MGRDLKKDMFGPCISSTCLYPGSLEKNVFLSEQLLEVMVRLRWQETG